ncbi:hypothetical protein JYT79_01805 [Cardiobacterium sp. AH-315-I02]|nr:hypothetical protein [Cardiobacterium sp. AH-315-I02]
MATIPDWITAIASIIGVGVIFIAIGQFKAALAQVKVSVAQLETSTKQLELSTKNLGADHERSRRETAINLLVEWSTNLNRRGSIARKFAETLDFNQSKELFNENAIKIDIKNKHLILGCLPDTTDEKIKSWDDNKTIDLSENESAEIRWIIVSYLNTLETIMTAWRHNLADKQIISEQFSYLVSAKDGHAILKNFREAAGGRSSFPGIADFVEETEKVKATGGKDKIA